MIRSITFKHRKSTNFTKQEKDVFSHELKVFPIPATDQLFVEITAESLDKNSFIEIYDLMGKILYKNEINKGITEISMSNFAIGTYILKFVTKDNIFTKRISKQ